MAREKKWDNESARVKAYRERKRLESLGMTVPPDVAVEAAYADLAEPALPDLPVGRAAPPVEEYVALQLAITRAELDARRDRGGRERPADAADIDEAGRLERTEAYARYRHAGFVAGEIASL